MDHRLLLRRLRLPLAGALLGWAAAAAADVTTEQKIGLNLAGFVRMNGTSTESLSGDKQRKDSQMHCEGFMSLLCGKAKSGEIVRLDRDLEWRLQPDKKRYTEQPFPTPEQRALAKQKMQEMAAKLQECQRQRPQGKQAVDKSKCDLSPPKVEVKKSDETATLAGHLARRSSVTLTQTCTDRETGDVCDLVYGFDAWLTADEIPGLAEQRAFTRAHMKKLGLDPEDDVMKGQVRRLMAQYADTFKQLSQKAGDLKGHPLRTRFYLAMGGEHCARAKQSSSAEGSAEGGGGMGGAASAIKSKLLGGLFGGKKSSEEPAGAQAGGANAQAPGAPVTLVEFSVETVAIDAAAIPPERFEIPAGWTLEPPQPPGKERDVDCKAADAG